MSNDVIPTKEDVLIARQGIKKHLNAAYDEKTRYSFEDFLENQAQVIAHLRAYNRKLENIIKDME